MDFSKALSGIYENNELNRKLGRVGQKYDHSSGHIIVDSVLISLKDEIDSMVKKSVDYLQSVFDKKSSGQVVSSMDAEYIRIGIISDMSIALSKYIKPTDKFISVSKLNSPTGSLEIKLKINRDNKDHVLETDVVLAGGYNIQQLHHRYITKTNLPLLNNDSVKKAYKEKIDKLSKAEKIIKELEVNQNLINKLTSEVEIAKSKTDKQILDNDENYSAFSKVTWEVIVNRGADKNYKDKQDFLRSQEEYKQSILNSFKKINIEFKEKSILSLKKTRTKLELKLQQLSK